jgi:hypothetical protein
MKLKLPTLFLAAVVILTLAFLAPFPIPDPQQNLPTTPANTTTTGVVTYVADYTLPGPMPTATLQR